MKFSFILSQEKRHRFSSSATFLQGSFFFYIYSSHTIFRHHFTAHFCIIKIQAILASLFFPWFFSRFVFHFFFSVVFAIIITLMFDHTSSTHHQKKKKSFHRVSRKITVFSTPFCHCSWWWWLSCQRLLNRLARDRRRYNLFFMIFCSSDLLSFHFFFSLIFITLSCGRSIALVIPNKKSSSFKCSTHYDFDQPSTWFNFS